MTEKLLKVMELTRSALIEKMKKAGKWMSVEELKAKHGRKEGAK